MSAVYGIAGLVDGFVNGRNIRNGWQDRKDNKERQKRLDDLTFTQDARAAEEHGKRMRVYDENATDWQRTHDDNEAMRTAGQAAVDAANAAMGAQDPGEVVMATPVQTTASTSGSTAPGPVESVAANLGIPMGAIPNRTADSMPSPEEMMRRYGTNGQPEGGKFAVRADATGNTGVQGGAAGMLPAGASQPEYIIGKAPSAAIADELYQQGPAGVRYIPNPNYRAPQPPAAAPSSGIGWGATDTVDPRAYGAAYMGGNAAETMRPDYNHNFGLDGPGLPSDAAEIAKRGVAAAGNVATKVAGIPGAAGDAMAPSMNAALNYITGHQRPAAAPAKTGPEGMKALSDTFKAATDPTKQPAVGLGPRKSNASANAAPETKAMAETATNAMAEAATPAIKAAAEASAKSGPALGVKPSDAVTEPQRKRAAASFIDQYMKVGAPIVLEEMLKQGQFEKAQKFQEFLDQTQTKAGMENWARAAFAANVGDMDTFADEIMEAYNRLDYFPDGTTIVKEASGFTYDKTGKISGAKITFKDGQTGNTFDQVFSDPNDLVRLGITLLAPENAFEHYAAQEQGTAKTEADRAAAAKKAAIESEAALTKRIDEATKLIFEKTVDEMGNPTLSYADARKMAEREIRGKPPGALQGPPMPPPPVAYRPGN